MIFNTTLKALTGILAIFTLSTLSALGAVSADKPNIIILFADDLGYADLGCQGSEEVVSPHIDSIAENGVRFTSGYVSAPQCCPSRAGLLPGRYQNRFGFEDNNCNKSIGGLPLSEKTIADYLKAAGYATGMVGKWHLGDGEPFRPYNRGFDETLWHANGGILFPDPRTGFLRDMMRGPEPIEIAEYSTDAFGREACEFIDRHQNEPFFLYVSFVPPHWPMEAKSEHMEQYAHVRDMHRRTMLGMMASLDENVGRILEKLRTSDLEENTLIFFLSDNGGPTGSPRENPDAPFQFGQNASLNDPCRGVKGELLEGGIRVPFVVQWKGRIPAGRVLDHPVISLDIVPTALAVSGIGSETLVEERTRLDGVNLLPYLMGESDEPPHETLFWRFQFPPNRPELYRWAIRQGDWKLVKNGSEPLSLYNLADDVGETINLAAEHPERLQALQDEWNQWDTLNQEPQRPKVEPNTPYARQARVGVLPKEYYVECLGNDPQIVFNRIPAAEGPFTLELRIKSSGKGQGMVFWGAKDNPTFSAERSVTFLMKHDGEHWHEYVVDLPATETAITHLRLDPGAAPGIVRIAKIVLKDASGNVVKSWIE
jgi:arylsulfatase A-like enzyme